MRLDWTTCKLQPGLLHTFRAASTGSRIKTMANWGLLVKKMY